MSGARVFLVAAEASGDLLGREVVEALRKSAPDIELAAIGGTELAAAGLSSPIDISPLSVLGLFEGLKAYPTAVKLADAATDAIIAFKPDAVVLIDSWGFMVRVAQRLRKRAPDIRIIKLVGPQVWATRAGRAKTLAETVDELLCIHQMEAPYYEPYNLPTTVIGPPALSRTKPGDGAAFRDAHGIAQDAEVLILLPGSRPSEIKRVAPTLMSAAKLIKAQKPDVQIIYAPAASIEDMFLEAFPGAAETGFVLTDQTARYDAMAAADLALACSGTVTSELAIQGAPFLVGYKLGWITWAIARTVGLYKQDYMTLLNIAAGAEVAQEFLQTKFKSAPIAAAALDLLRSPEKRAAQTAAQFEAIKKMGAGDKPAAEIAAEAILSGIIR